MAVQIQLRNDTASNWTAANPILAIGEIGIETDTEKFKIGNGVDDWDTRPYGGIVGPQGPALELQSTATHIQWRVVGAQDWIDLVALTALGRFTAIVTEIEDFEFDANHIGMYVRVDSEDPITATLPEELGNDGDVIEIRNVGDGALTLIEDNIIIAPPYQGSLVLPTGATAALKRVSGVEWDLIGQTEAAT